MSKNKKAYAARLLRKAEKTLLFAASNATFTQAHKECNKVVDYCNDNRGYDWAAEIDSKAVALKADIRKQSEVYAELLESGKIGAAPAARKKDAWDKEIATAKRLRQYGV